jgi:hypothetical protein
MALMHREQHLFLSGYTTLFLRVHQGSVLLHSARKQTFELRNLPRSKLQVTGKV